MNALGLLPILATVVMETEDQSDEQADGAQSAPFVAAESTEVDSMLKPVDWVREHSKFTFSGSLDTLFMGVVGGGGADSATGMDATLIFEHPLLSRSWDKHLTLYGRLRYRSGLWNQAPAALGPSIGTAWGVIDGFNDVGFEIPDFFLRQLFPSKDLELRYGQMVIDSQLDGQPVGGAKSAFHNRAFASNPAAAFPRLGAGATIAWDPDGPWDLVYALTTVQGSESGDQVDFKFSSSNFFQALQFGYSFPGDDPGPRRLQLMLWHSDEAPESDKAPGEGLSLTYSHRFDDPITSAFCRIAYASGEVSEASLIVVGGITAERSEKEVVGIGIGIGEGNLTNNWNGVVEGFYRRSIGDHGSAAINGQLLVGEGFNDSGSVRLLLGASARVSF